MFRNAHLVFKSGELVVRDGKIANLRWGRTVAVRPPDATRSMQKRLADYWETYYGYSAGLFDVRESAVAGAASVDGVFEGVACRG
jgi:formylmethanofuran dehydrogenase subunit A